MTDETHAALLRCVAVLKKAGAEPYGFSTSFGDPRRVDATLVWAEWIKLPVERAWVAWRSEDIRRVGEKPLPPTVCVSGSIGDSRFATFASPETWDQWCIEHPELVSAENDAAVPA